jgi:hypothetical protein
MEYDTDMSTSTETLSSLSHLSAGLGVSVARIVAVVEREGIRPALYMDSTPFYDDQGEERIRQALEKSKAGAGGKAGRGEG